MLGVLVRAGHSPDRLLDYPIDKLELLFREACAAKHRQTLDDMDAFRTAEASVHGGKTGHEAYVKFRRELRRASEA